jgi:uncharacterized SAM-binding protein YcdF (DUF218 family)
MFFILSKTVAVLLRPSILICLVGVIGLVLMAMGPRGRRYGRMLTVGGFVALIVLGLSPLGAVLTHALEVRFPKWEPGSGAPDGIVVLGGAISPKMSRQRDEPVVGNDAGRILAVARLARAYPQARIVYSGGDGTLLAKDGAEADYVLPLLDMFGIARDRVVLEPRSRNTFENAAFSKDIAKPKPGERWLLVTSARHMPRAIGCFRQAGFAVEAYPTDWRTELKYRYRPSLDIVDNLARLDSAVAEWTGLLAYWVSGKTSAFFPAP